MDGRFRTCGTWMSLTSDPDGTNTKLLLFRNIPSKIPHRKQAEQISAGFHHGQGAHARLDYYYQKSIFRLPSATFNVKYKEEEQIKEIDLHGKNNKLYY